MIFLFYYILKLKALKSSRGILLCTKISPVYWVSPLSSPPSPLLPSPSSLRCPQQPRELHPSVHEVIMNNVLLKSRSVLEDIIRSHNPDLLQAISCMTTDGRLKLKRNTTASPMKVLFKTDQFIIQIKDSLSSNFFTELNFV